MDKSLRNIIIAGIIIIALSFAYYLVYRPMKKQESMKQCAEQTGGWGDKQKDQEKWKIEYDKCLKEKGL